MYGFKNPDFERPMARWLLVDRTSRICSRSDPQQPPMTPKPHCGLTTEVLPYDEFCIGVLQKTRIIYILVTLLARWLRLLIAIGGDGARALGVASLVSFVVRDFRQFHVEIPDDVMPSDVLCYIYLIPKMVNNRDLRSQVVRLLEQGATFVCWQYLPRDWPHLWKEDTKFGIQIYRRGDL